MVLGSPESGTGGNGSGTPIKHTLGGARKPTIIGTRPEWDDILRIIISTDGSKLRREEARELNVNLYVEKPFRPEVVRDVLCQIASVGAH